LSAKGRGHQCEKQEPALLIDHSSWKKSPEASLGVRRRFYISGSFEKTPQSRFRVENVIGRLLAGSHDHRANHTVDGDSGDLALIEWGEDET